MSSNNCNTTCSNGFAPDERETKLMECLAEKYNLSIVDALIDGIAEYNCGNDGTYSCGDIVVFEGGFYESLLNDNDRHPHDSDAWKSAGSLKDALAGMDSSYSYLKVDYHNSCGNSQFCKPFYAEGDLVAVQEYSGEIDSCGNAIMVDVYYTSLTDANTEMPSATATNWNGPSTAEELITGGAITGASVCAALGTLPTGSCP